MQDIQEIYTTTIASLPSEARLRLAALIINRLAESQTSSAPRQSVRQMVKRMPKQRLFQTAAEVDDYLKEERESWEH